MLWIPSPVWEGQDVYLIGGGSSLSSFNWHLLKDEFTIGINAAYILGKEISKVVVFGDVQFFNEHSKGLEKYAGPVFTNCEELLHSPYPFLYTMRRIPFGIHKDGLGWNNSTGAVAINLAILLGAKRIILLGYDGQAVSAEKWNWHQYQNKENRQELFCKFKEGFSYMMQDYRVKYKHIPIINVSDVSKLEHFPKVGIDDWFKSV